MRYTSSTLFALIISFITFLGMSLLIAKPSYNKVSQFESISFSKMDDVEKQKVKIDKPNEPPKKVKVKQPPARPNLDITHNTERPTLDYLPSPVSSKNFSTTNMLLPTINKEFGDNNINGDRALTCIYNAQPQYPEKALRNNIEGWVKVEFVVNELGKVINAKVIDAKPKRIFNAASLRAISRSKFKPLTIDGKAVSQTAVQVIEFKIEK